jgi:hypothetical protein
VSYLVVEKPENVREEQATLLCACLSPWHHATALPVSEDEPGDFPEAERPDLCTLLGRLVGALTIWHEKRAPNAPMPANLVFWQKYCASNPLPEVQRSIHAWRFLEKVQRENGASP